MYYVLKVSFEFLVDYKKYPKIIVLSRFAFSTYVATCELRVPYHQIVLVAHTSSYDSSMFGQLRPTSRSFFLLTGHQNDR